MSNFEFMSKYWLDIAQLGKTAEWYLFADANACIYKIGILAERVAQESALLRRLNYRIRLCKPIEFVR